MLPGPVAQDAAAQWPASAVRDTVAAIVDDPAYERVLTQSVFDQILLAIGRALRWFFDLLPAVGIGDKVLVLLAIVLLVLVVARVILRARARREHWAGDAGDHRRGRRADPWLEAERLAAQGEHLAAAHALCAALLSASARRGEVTLHPSKTTGDYLREMRRRRAPSEFEFARFRARYDRVVYDAQRCTPDDYAALLEAARPLLDAARPAPARVRAA